MNLQSDRSETAPADAPSERRNRNWDIQLMPESLARAHIPNGVPPAAGPAARVPAARRLQRSAGRATLRARRALAMAVIR